MCEIKRKWLKIKLHKGVSKKEIVRPKTVSTLKLAHYACKDECVLNKVAWIELAQDRER